MIFKALLTILWLSCWIAGIFFDIGDAGPIVMMLGIGLTYVWGAYVFSPLLEKNAKFENVE